MKLGDARAPVARAIAARLPARERAVFLAACGLEGDGEALVARALAAAGRAFAWVDPRPHLARVRPPVVIVHGRDDDVIPWLEAHKIADALPTAHPRDVVLTGLWGHTGARLPSPRALADEARALGRVLRHLATAAART